MTEHLQSDAAHPASCGHEQAAPRPPWRVRFDPQRAAGRSAVFCSGDPRPVLLA